MQGYYTAKQVGDRLGISESRVRDLARTLSLGLKVNPRLWMFTEADIEQMRQRDTKRGPKSRKGRAE